MGYGAEESETFQVCHCAEIFRDGQVSHFKRVGEFPISVESLSVSGFSGLVQDEIVGGRMEIKDVV